MDWREKLLDQLADCVPCGYERGGPMSTEPTALASIALVALGRRGAAAKGMEWLTEMQQTDGSVGPAEGLSSPGWPTSLAILADVVAHGSDSHERDGFVGFVEQSGATSVELDRSREVRPSKFDRQRAVEWLLATKGGTVEKAERGGHDSTLVGWPWAEGTHSWVEPTALAVLALKAVGLGDHERTREAVRLLHDRLFSDGGCNYGNTVVLGQTLRPHLQPTALALLALWQEADSDGRITRSIDYLEAGLYPDTPTASLCYGVLALRRHRRDVERFESALARAYDRVVKRGGSPYKLALLAMAAVGGNGTT
jgi:hypothetical protein